MIYNFNNYLFHQKEREILANSQKTSSFISMALAENKLSVVRSLLEVLARINNGQVWLINSQGGLVMTYPVNIDNSPVRYFRYQEVLAGKIVSQQINLDYFKEPMILIGLPLRSPYNQVNYGLLVFTPISGIRKVVYQVVRLMFFSALLAILISILIAYNWSRSLSDPLKDISGFALRLNSGEFGENITLTGGKGIKEINDLSKSINQLSLTLEQTINNLIEEKNKLNYVLSGMQEGVLAVNKERKIIIINNSACKWLCLEKYSRNVDLTGRKLNEVIDKGQVIDMFTKVLNSREIYSGEVSVKNDGVLIRLLVHLTPIQISSRLWGGVALIHDITERRRFEELQREFVTNVSHDLKTPLSSIKGASEILLDGIVNTEEKKQKYLRVIVEESNRLERLVKEILTLGERQSAEKEKINAGKLVENVFMIFNSIIANGSKDITLVKKVPGEIIYIKASPEKLKQVLLNLLDNAYKYSKQQGTVVIACSLENNRVKFWIRDNGIGIPADELENIWERFYKVDKVRSNVGEGSGLGLSIVKQIVEAQGGTVFVDSKSGQGSTFGFYIDQC